MSTTLVLTLAGMVLGTALWSSGGWSLGACLGFLLGQLLSLSAKVKQQEVELRQFKTWRKRIEEAGELASNPPSAANTGVYSPASTQSGASAPTITAPTIPETPPVVTPEPVVTSGPVVTPTEPLPELHGQAVDVPSNARAQQLARAELWENASAPHQSTESSSQKSPPPLHPLTSALGLVRDFFTRGNPIVRVGMVVMFFGLSFLAKYAASQGFFPVELRLAILALAAIALIIFGWKTRARAGGYGLVLQGGGVAALYLTIFSAAKLFGLMPLATALILMIVVAVLGGALALLQNAQVLALMATAGGFLAPILTADHSGNHVGLFSYYLILNLGILALAWFKTWRLLNWTGFVFTFVIASLWGVLQYQPYFYASTQPFLIVYFALYLVVSVLFSLKQPPQLRGLVDASLVFGLPIVSFALQSGLVKHTEYGMAVSALVLALVYTLLAKALWGKYRLTHMALVESFIALAVGFATLAIPLALGAAWTSASWALEACGLLWIGLRQARLLPRFAGYLLYLAAALALLNAGLPSAGSIPLVSGDFLSLALLAFTAFAAGYLLSLHRAQALPVESWLEPVAMWLGWGWWLAAGAIEINGHITGLWLLAAVLVFISGSCAILPWSARRLAWPALTQLGYSLLPLASLISLLHLGDELFRAHPLGPLAYGGWFALPVFFAIQYRFLWLKRATQAQGFVGFYHVLGAWLLFGYVGWQIQAWQIVFAWDETLSAVIWFGVLALLLGGLLALLSKDIWPLNQYSSHYRGAIPGPLAIALLLWFLAASKLAGHTGEFYLPLFNPLDLAQLAVLVLVLYCFKCNLFQLQQAPAQLRFGLPALLGFAWLNLVLVRALHEYLGIDYRVFTLWNSTLVQMALSILWGLCALIIMHLARRWQQRQLWLVGAGLLAMILLKLVFKDLSGRGTLAGIVSFVAVGALMLVIGYVSPMPTKKSAAPATGQNSAE